MPSQFGQDWLVLRLLGGMRGGFFLDSGASDGVRASNTLLLERKFGWNGICIEPNDSFYEALVRNRRCHCVRCCLYDHEGTVDFVEANTMGGILDAYHPSLLGQAMNLAHLRLDAAGRPTTVRKPSRTVRSILKEYGAPHVIDYWSLDTEGSELAILRSFPFEAYRVRVLTVEHNNFPIRDELRSFMFSLGYAHVGEIGVDDCFALPELRELPAWRSAVWRR